MQYLQILKKDKLFFFALSIGLSIVGAILYPFCVKDLYYYYFTPDFDMYVGNVYASLGIVFLMFPSLWFFYIPKISQYIFILLDMKKPVLVENTVVGLKKPSTEAFDLYKQGTEDENDFHYIWLVEDEKGKKMKMLFFKDVFAFAGKTINHSYKVTYFQHSKVLVKVECQSKNTGDG